MPTKMKRTFYVAKIDFDSTINAGADDTKISQLDSAGRFIIEAMQCKVWLAVAQTAIAYTPFGDTPSPTLGSNTFPTNNACRLMLTVAGVDWFQGPIRLSALCGVNGSPFYFQTKPTVINNNEIKARLYNDAATYNIQGQIAFIGYKLTAA